MSAVEVKNSSGTIVWRSTDVDEPIVEIVGRTVRVTDLQTGQVLATYDLKPDERVVEQ